ncbi:hypothetical protein V6N13_052721 [Hibiscus sabdariffa]|uniref:Uncharacterized protein n=1 Tax=Hibiscus sabdariffa TaxID=183260 RepID=A0ABR2Q550_9ROSI
MLRPSTARNKSVHGGFYVPLWNSLFRPATATSWNQMKSTPKATFKPIIRSLFTLLLAQLQAPSSVTAGENSASVFNQTPSPPTQLSSWTLQLLQLFLAREMQGGILRIELDCTGSGNCSSSDSVLLMPICHCGPCTVMEGKSESFHLIDPDDNIEQELSIFLLLVTLKPW